MKIWRCMEDVEDVKTYNINIIDYDQIGQFVHPRTLQPMMMLRKNVDSFPDPEDNDIFIVPMKLQESE